MFLFKDNGTIRSNFSLLGELNNKNLTKTLYDIPVYSHLNILLLNFLESLITTIDLHVVLLIDYSSDSIFWVPLNQKKTDEKYPL